MQETRHGLSQYIPRVAGGQRAHYHDDLSTPVSGSVSQGTPRDLYSVLQAEFSSDVRTALLPQLGHQRRTQRQFVFFGAPSQAGQHRCLAVLAEYHSQVAQRVLIVELADELARKPQRRLEPRPRGRERRILLPAPSAAVQHQVRVPQHVSHQALLAAGQIRGREPPPSMSYLGGEGEVGLGREDVPLVVLLNVVPHGRSVDRLPVVGDVATGNAVLALGSRLLLRRGGRRRAREGFAIVGRVLMG
mmetsp:Transcript_31127/g.66264  ORF Transcript_31127/g.66264 Transcript_31127/m.66264 type:complete len:246 (-) Transcript_31127:217-954(-)